MGSALKLTLHPGLWRRHSDGN